VTTTTVAAPPVLRDYQLETLDALATYRGADGHRALVALPTGTGKTVIFAQVPSMSSKRVLVLVHRDELVRQTVRQMRQWNPEKTVGVEKASDHAGDESVVVASVQTLSATGFRRVRKFDPADFSVIIVDEAHHAPATSYMGVLAHFGLAPDLRDVMADAHTLREVGKKVVAAVEEGRVSIADGMGLRHTIKQARNGLRELTAYRISSFSVAAGSPYLMGFTATPSRTDGTGLEAIFDEIVYSRSIREMMEAGWLTPLTGQQVATEVDISGVHTQAGDYVESELAEAVNVTERNVEVVRAFGEYAPGRQALCFAVDVAHTRALCETFMDEGIEAVSITGDTPVAERQDAYKRYANREVRVLVNCMVLTEGFDAPQTDCLLMARPTKSKLLYTQMLGRGTRPSPGKADCVVIDFVDNAKVGVVGLNVLFGLPPSLVKVPDVLKALAEEEDQLAAKAQQKATQTSEQTGTFDPLMEEVVAQLGGDLVWIKMPYGYATSTFKGTRLGLVENLLGRWDVKLHIRGEKPVGMGSEPTVERAVQVAEAWVAAHEGESMHVLAADAAWRGMRPSSAQISFAKRLGITVTESMSKGDLSALIDQGVEARQSKPITQRQVSWLRNQHGVTLPEGATLGDFNAAINEARRAESVANMARMAEEAKR